MSSVRYKMYIEDTCTIRNTASKVLLTERVHHYALVALKNVGFLKVGELLL